MAVAHGRTMDVCWIDSKAMYGDPVTHRGNEGQAEAYVHRYGPGVILYWFGHSLEAEDAGGGDVGVVEFGVPKFKTICDVLRGGGRGEMRKIDVRL